MWQWDSISRLPQHENIAPNWRFRHIIRPCTNEHPGKWDDEVAPCSGTVYHLSRLSRFPESALVFGAGDEREDVSKEGHALRT